MGTPIRPLGALSNFVCEQLPVALREPGTLVDTVIDLINRTFPGEAVTMAAPGPFGGVVTKPSLGPFGNERVRAIARLDLKMLQAAIENSGLRTPGELAALIERFRGGTLPVLTYEDIVLANPPDDMRTFTDGNVGETEKLFYRTHQLIEAALESVLPTIAKCCETGAVSDLGDVEGAIGVLSRGTEELSHMAPGHFDQFRRYLNGYCGMKGSSGMFSESIPRLEVLLRGELPPKYRDQLVRDWEYYPVGDRPKLEHAIVLAWHKKSLIQRALTNDALRIRVEAIIALLDQWRSVHMRAVFRQLKPTDIGTGAVPAPMRFLQGRREEMQNLPTS